MCQIKNIGEMGSEIPFLVRIRQLLTNLKKPQILLLILEGKIARYKKSMKRKISKRSTKTAKKQNSKELKNHPVPTFKAGDVVKIRSKEQILKTLDKDKKLDGCFFMNEMWQYCGTKHKVFKIVEHFFDETNFKLYKARKIILLEGLHCSGELPYLEHRCDRSCLYFWKEDWLEKIK